MKAHSPARLVVFALALLLPLLVPSCVAVAAAGVGAAATYGVLSARNNHVSREFRSAPEPTWMAAVYALKAQDYEFAGEPDPESVDGEINVAGGSVWVQRERRGTTRVRIRMGTFESDDNLRAARRLMEEIARRLGE